MVRKMRLIFSPLILFAMLWPQVVLADGMIMPELADVGYVAVKYHRVTVDIEDIHAVTRVEQAFYNPHDVPVTAAYVFPLPPDTMVTDFKVDVDGEDQAIQRQDVATTNETLRRLIAERHDPSLLQYVDWESLTFELTLQPHATRTMTLRYEEVLTPVGGMLHYHYILSTERYSADLLEEAVITVNVRSPHGIGTLYAPSHTLSTEQVNDEHVRATWRAEYVRPTEDFHLYIAPTTTDSAFSSGLLTGHQPAAERGERDHFLFLFAPSSGIAEQTSLPKDIVFVIDRSGSMEGEKIEQAQRALRYILSQLGAEDRFAIVGFDDRIDLFAHTLQPVNTRTLRAARRFVDDLYARDSTDLDMALHEGLDLLRKSEHRAGASRMLIFLTDGLPTAGVTDVASIATRAQETNAQVEARLHVFGVGYDVNTHLLDQLAGKNGGSVRYVQPGEDLELVLTNFYRRIAHPVLTDLQIEFEGMEVQDLHPQTLPDMFAGSTLLLSGRYLAHDPENRIIIRVSGRSGERDVIFTYAFDLAKTGDHAFVPRLWATREIGRQLDIVRVEGESEALVETIRNLGLTYGLVTPYTAFVIAAQAQGAASVENMALYSRGAVLNQAWGQTTIQARVQNQLYQGAAQANLATGANVINSGHHNLAQVSAQQLDLTLLQGKREFAEPLNDAWIAENIDVDRQIAFGSDAYFALTDDPRARAFLQAGNNVIFRHKGEIIQVWDDAAPPSNFELPSMPTNQETANNLRQFSNNATLPLNNVVSPTPRTAWLDGPLAVLRHLAYTVYSYVREAAHAVTP